MTLQERERRRRALLLLATRPIPAEVKAVTARELAPHAPTLGWPMVWANLIRAVATVPVDVAGMLRQAETVGRLVSELVPEPVADSPAWAGIAVSVVHRSDLSPWFRRPAQAGAVR